MLLRLIVLLIDIPLQGCEDGPPRRQRLPTLPLQISQLLIRRARSQIRLRQASGGGDGEILEFLAEDNDGLFRQQGVL